MDIEEKISDTENEETVEGYLMRARKLIEQEKLTEALELIISVIKHTRGEQ